MPKIRYDPKDGTPYAPNLKRGDVVEIEETQVEGYLQMGCWELVEDKPKPKPKVEDKKGAD